MPSRFATLCSQCICGSVFLFLPSSFVYAAEVGVPLVRPFRSQLTGDEHNYALYLPRGYDADEDKKWPVILFLHGAGERGDSHDDLPWVYAHGPMYEALVQRRDLPFMIIAPQMPVLDQKMFVAMRAGKTPPTPTPEGETPPERVTFSFPIAIERVTGADLYPTDEFFRRIEGWDLMDEEVIAILDEVLAEYRADADRVYLTGLSLGGMGSFHLAARYPGRWAAVAPIVGIPPMADATMLAESGIPMWLFGGGKDRLVKVHWLYEIARILETAKHPDFIFTIHEDLGHDAWVRVYGGEDIYNWFLDHERVGAGPISD